MPLAPLVPLVPITLTLTLGLGLVLCPALRAQTPLADPLPDIPTSSIVVALQEVVSTLVFPVDVAAPADGSPRLFVTGFDGRITLLRDGIPAQEPFADLRQTPPFSSSSSAMSAIAFHPDFAHDEAAGVGGRLYVVMIEAPGSGVTDFGAGTGVQQSVLYELRPSIQDPDREDATARREILRIDEASVLHNLNDLAFGPDGYLYASKGDDLTGGQDTGTIHGTILRIDVDRRPGNPLSANGAYAIPAHNPFVGDPAGLDEIYAFGFRNPWRMTFDTRTGDFYVADVGERDIEEVNRVDLAPDGTARNYGWNEMEGTFRYLDPGVTDDLTGLPPGFDGTAPVAQYDHTEQDVSITGGLLYRGSAFPALYGKYLFGEWVSGMLFQFDPQTGALSRLVIDPDGARIHGRQPFTGGEPQEGAIALRADVSGEPLILVTQRNGTPTGRILRISALPIGERYCDPAVPNSTGQSAVLRARGSLDHLHGDVTLIASGLPLEFGYVLVSRTPGLFSPPGSAGLLCLAGNIGRYNQPASILMGPEGSLVLDLSVVPVNPPVPVLAGDTWRFQCWYRDHVPAATSNFTDAVSLTFH